MRLLRRDIWWVALDPTVGAGLQKKRPCVIVQRDAANATSPTTIICPVTSASGKAPGLTKVLLLPGKSGLEKASMVLCNQVRVVDASRLGERIGRVDSETMAAIDRGLRAILDL